jgi:hypothetical protein
MEENTNVLGTPQPRQERSARSRKKWVFLAVLAIGIVALAGYAWSHTTNAGVAPFNKAGNQEIQGVDQTPPQPSNPREVKPASGDILNEAIEFDGKWERKVVIQKATRINVQYGFDQAVKFEMTDETGNRIWQVSNLDWSETHSRNVWSNMDKDMEYTLRFETLGQASGRIMIAKLDSL